MARRADDYPLHDFFMINIGIFGIIEVTI
jgi:hypothetical protein